MYMFHNFSKKVDVSYTVKTFVCVAVFVAVSAFFSLTASDIANNYPAGLTTGWFVRLCGAALLFIAMLGINVVLLKPVWLNLAVYFLNSLVLLFVLGFNQVAAITAGVLFVGLSLFYLPFIARQLKNQINFSVYPLAQKKLSISCLLALILAVAFAQGYIKDSVKRAYILPPEIKTSIQNSVNGLAEGVLKDQQGGAQQKKEMMKTIKEKTGSTLNEVEKQLQPYKENISVVMGVIAFGVFQMVFFILVLFGPVFVWLLFAILKLTRFTHVSVEKVEVKKLTLS